MPKQNPPMKSWQIFHYARKHLGSGVLYAIFGKKNARTVDYWCQDPRTTGKEEDASDAICGVKLLLDKLDDLGHTSVVRAAVAFFKSGTSLEEDYHPSVSDLLPSIAEEKLADFHKVAEFQAAIDRGEGRIEVGVKKQAAIEEIERTWAKYLEFCK